MHKVTGLLGLAASLIVLAAGSCWAQDVAFEAASVKPSTTSGREVISGGPGTSNPGELRYSGVSIQHLIMRAYGVSANQVTGPEWLSTERFDLTAKLPANATTQQIGPMLRSLLAERFRLQAHHDSREVTGYELTVAKSGLKMKESAGNLMPSPPLPDGKEGRPMGTLVEWNRTLHRGAYLLTNGMWRFSGRGQSPSELASFCEVQMRMPVVDHTGLKGVFDWDIDTVPSGPPRARGSDQADSAAQDPGPDLATALEHQLGLRLEKKKISIDMIVVDRLERAPIEN